jgi:hypothetical protein
MENAMRLNAVNVSLRIALLFFLLLIPHFAIGQQPTWIATWTASPEAAEPDPDDGLLNLNDQTVRERVRVTVGGEQIRIRLSNECSSVPILVGRVSVGVAQSPTSVVPGSLPRVTFGGQNAILIPPGSLC